MNYSVPRLKAIPMTKLHSSYNFPWLSNFNYNSVSLQLLSLYFFSLSNWAHTQFFLPANRSSLLACPSSGGSKNFSQSVLKKDKLHNIIKREMINYCCLVVSLICLSFINYNLLYYCFINYKIINCCLA